MDNHLGKVSQKCALGRISSRQRHLPLGINQSQNAMKEVQYLKLPNGTLKHFLGTKNTALKDNTKPKYSAIYGIDYLLPKAFYFLSLPANSCFFNSNISTNLSPERNHLPKAQMELPCEKFPWKEGVT